MLKAILCVLLFLGNQAVAAAPSAEKLKHCTEVGQIASTVMSSRQKEVSMAKLMAIKTGDTALDNLVSSMTEDAYAQSAFRSPENQERAKNEFENKWFALCLK